MGTHVECQCCGWWLNLLYHSTGSKTCIFEGFQGATSPQASVSIEVQSLCFTFRSSKKDGYHSLNNACMNLKMVIHNVLFPCFFFKLTLQLLIIISTWFGFWCVKFLAQGSPSKTPNLGLWRNSGFQPRCYSWWHLHQSKPSNSSGLVFSHK